MRRLSALILLVVLLALSMGESLAQEAQNATNVTSDLNATNDANATAPVIGAAAAVAVPQETVSKYRQLSNYTKGAAAVLGKNIPSGYSDVSKTADSNAIFSRGAGVPSPSIKMSITKVNTLDNKYVEITNQAVGSWDLAGWKLVSAGNTTFTFPALTLEEGQAVLVHEGNGVSTKTDLFTNSTNPLWIDNLVALQDASGKTVSSYDISASPAAAGSVDPLAGRIQY